MNFLRFWDQSSFITRLILGVVTVHLIIGAGVHLYWTASGSGQVLRLYFDYEGVAAFLLFGALQVFCAVAAYREFSHQPLGAAWLYIMLASICYFLGTICRHLLAVDSGINPIAYGIFGASDQLRGIFGNIGTVLGGPVQMILLAAGLYMALRVYRQLGMLARLKPFDIALFGAAALYSITVLVGIFQAVRNHPSNITVDRALTWPGDYLLTLLLLEAVFLRRSALEMGSGYVSKVWGAFVAGIFLTSFCSLMNWLTAYGILSWTQTAFVWYLWYPASAAFALAPAYQWEAMRTAQLRLAKPLDELEFQP
jgi:hypothetical protein